MADILAVTVFELAFGQANALEHLAEIVGFHAVFYLVEALVEDFSDLAFVDLNAVLFGLEDKHLFVDHGVEGLHAHLV